MAECMFPFTDFYCTCTCSCGNFEATPSQISGGLTGHVGGKEPSTLGFNQDDTPHPIFRKDAVLSSNVATASYIEMQLTVGSLSKTVYYSPAGYQANEDVLFATQIDAGTLATGEYKVSIQIIEHYSNGSNVTDVIHQGSVQIENRDNSPYGHGWTLHNISQLYIQSASSTQDAGVTLADGSGNMMFWYFNNSTGAFQSPNPFDDVASFVENTDGTYTLTYKDGSTSLFTSTGLLASTQDAAGNATTYSHNADGTVSSVTDPTGETTTFSYTNGLLTSSTDFSGRVTSYGYDGSGRLTSITRPSPGNGEATPVTTFAYDPTTSLMTSYTDSSGTTEYSYDAFRQVTKITNPDGTYQQFDAPRDYGAVDTSSGLGTLSDPAPLVAATVVIATQTDENGNVTHYTTNPIPNVYYGNGSYPITSVTDASGNTTTYDLNFFGQVTRITQPPLTPNGPNTITNFQYADNGYLPGNLIEEDLPDGTYKKWTYDSTFNEVTSYTTGYPEQTPERETDYAINPNNGEVTSITQVGFNGDANRVTSYTYTAGGVGQAPAGLVATITDPRGIETQISYNADGLPTQIIYAYGTADQASVSYTYDANDNPATYTDELGRVTNFTFDDLNRLIQTILPAPDPNNPSVRPTTSQVWDARGNLLQVTDPLGYVTSYAYDPGSDGDNPQLNKMTQPDPTGGVNYTITQYGHDNAGNLTTTTDPMNRITTLGYDADSRQSSVQLPNPVGGGTGGPTSSVVYDALGDVIKSFDDKGAETDYTYDAMGRVLTITGPAPTQGAQRPVTTYTYNADGQVLTETDPMGHVTSYQYDSFGELVQETLPDPDGAGPLTSSILKWTYDADGNMASATDGLNHNTTYAYDNLNRKSSETDPLTGVTHYNYDAAGNMTSLEDPDGNTTTYVYDGLNRVTSETNQLTQTRSFVYDLNGNLTQETDRDGRVRDFTYDHLNRQTAEQWMSGSTVLETFSYSYNADGQLTSASNPDSAYAYSYDGMGRVTSVDNNGTPNVPDVVLTNQYDSNSNRTQLSATIAGTADFQNVYSYDALDRLTQLYQQGQMGGNAVATKGANLTYNLLGQLSTIARTNYFGVGPAPDIATSTFSYDGANRLTEIANTTNGGTAIDAYSWSYDAANRVATMTTTTDGTATYSYDNTNQVTGATYTTNAGATQPVNETYSYDSSGNRTNTGYSTGTNNQLSSDGTFNYTYDAEGNRATRTRISNAAANDYKTTYTWDYRDRLTDVQFYNNSNVLTKHVHYTYDVFDHLIGKQVDDTGGGTYNRAEFYVRDGNNVVLQFNAAGALTERYINGPSASGVDTVLAEEDVTLLASPGTVTWPLTDNLGTVRDIVDSTGAVIDHLVYNSFGQMAFESTTSVHHLEGYSVGLPDVDTGLVYFSERWYDPAAGRWISEDPVGFAGNDANLSRFVGNSPTSKNDPTGLEAMDMVLFAQKGGAPGNGDIPRRRDRPFINACDNALQALLRLRPIDKVIEFIRNRLRNLEDRLGKLWDRIRKTEIEIENNPTGIANVRLKAKLSDLLNRESRLLSRIDFELGILNRIKERVKGTGLEGECEYGFGFNIKDPFRRYKRDE